MANHNKNIIWEMHQVFLPEARIPCSIWVGANKLCAKQASEFKKPMGISILWPHEVKENFGFCRPTDRTEEIYKGAVRSQSF